MSNHNRLCDESTKMKVLSTAVGRIAIAFAIAAISGLASGQDRTSTGFFYPRSQDLGPYAAYLDSSCGSENQYIAGYFHLGKDSWGYLGQPVYAIADGEVIVRSLHGWIYGDLAGTQAGNGITTNIGLLIKHKTTQGFFFQAVYGHILSTLQPGDQVYAGKQIGTIGPYNGQEHVHFGVRIPLQSDGSDYPTANYGAGSCSAWPLGPQDRWIDPIQFITTRTPDNYLGGGSTPPAPTPTNGELHISFSPNSVSQSNGAWLYTVTVSETAGVAVPLTQMLIGGQDYTSYIGSWFGTTTVPAGGQISVGIRTTGSPGSLIWQFSSKTVNWAGAVTLNP